MRALHAGHTCRQFISNLTAFCSSLRTGRCHRCGPARGVRPHPTHLLHQIARALAARGQLGKGLLRRRHQGAVVHRARGGNDHAWRGVVGGDVVGQVLAGDGAAGWGGVCVCCWVCGWWWCGGNGEVIYVVLRERCCARQTRAGGMMRQRRGRSQRSGPAHSLHARQPCAGMPS